MKDPFEGLISSLQHRYEGVSFESEENRPPQLRSRKLGMYENMFIEDLGLRAFPYPIGNDDPLKVEIQTNDQGAAHLVTQAIPSVLGDYKELPDALREFIRVSLELLATDSLYLEIEYFRPSEDTGEKPVAFRVDWLLPERVSRLFWQYRYWMPIPRGGKQWSVVPLDRSCLIRVVLPKKVRYKLRKALWLLRSLDKTTAVTSKFISGTYGYETGFETLEFRQLVDALALRSLRSTGWTGRGLLSEKLLDPAKAWRAIQFERLVIQLRDIALRGLQDAVDKAGKVIGFKADILVTGKLTSGYLDQLERDLHEGTRPIGEIFSPRVVIGNERS